MMQGMNAAAAEEHRVASVAAEAKKAKHEAGERLEAAKVRLAALERGESVAGGLARSATWPPWRRRPASRRRT
jgi:hypothetical protein